MLLWKWNLYATVELWMYGFICLDCIKATDISLQTYVENNDNGTYTASFFPTRAGEYEIKVSIDGKHIREGPAKIRTYPLPTHRNLVLKIDSTKIRRCLCDTKGI